MTSGVMMDAAALKAALTMRRSNVVSVMWIVGVHQKSECGAARW